MAESFNLPFGGFHDLPEFIGLGQQLALAPKPAEVFEERHLITNLNLKELGLAVLVFLG